MTDTKYRITRLKGLQKPFLLTKIQKNPQKVQIIPKIQKISPLNSDQDDFIDTSENYFDLVNNINETILDPTISKVLLTKNFTTFY